jgi:hypothetical protein
MNVAAKTVMGLSLVAITSGLLIKSELVRPDYASAAVPAPGPSQKKIIVKNLRMA